jgi:membrane fusion protein (multidrug efflux system)
MKKSLYFLLLILCFASSCKSNKSTEEQNDMGTAEPAPSELYVDTVILKSQTFHKQLICNGKLKAIAKSELSFANSGMVVAVYVHNGDVVQKGKIIAETDKQDYLLEIEKAKKDLERAKVELSDKLIGLGYNGNGSDVPADVLNRAKVTSGYFAAQYALQSAQKHLKDCSLRAPFGGRIADLNSNRFQRMDKVCTLINDSYFDVEFSVMEAELKNIHKGQHVMVSPFVDDAISVSGEVVNINPTVSDKGLILVKARIKNGSGRLIDGMNVKVVIENDVVGSYVVPKDAVVERDGYHVVFEYKDGESVWTYVDIAHSNLSSHAITGCAVKETELHEGDIVITSGNLNLADGTKVKIRTKND